MCIFIPTNLISLLILEPLLCISRTLISTVLIVCIVTIIFYAGSTLIFGPDPEFCFALLNICNSKQYKFLALVPESIVTTTPTPRLVHDLKNFGATIHPIPESFVTSKELCLNEKAQALADSEGGINLIAFVMANDGVFNSEIDQLTQEIEKSEVVPHVFVGELDNLGILDRLHKLD